MPSIPFLVSRLGVYEGKISSEDAEKALVKLGAKAVPALVKLLGDETHGWQAASILFDIGLPAARRAVPALTKWMRAGKGEANCAWCARALVRLGRIDLVAPLLASAAHQYTAVQGLKEGRPESYPLFEKALARGNKKLSGYIEDALRPGSSAFEPTADDLPMMFEALSSPHAVIRRDVVSNLSNGKLGAEGKRDAVQALVVALDDADVNVRHLAVLGLGWSGRKLAGHAAPRLRTMAKDRNPGIRTAVASALQRLA